MSVPFTFSAGKLTLWAKGKTHSLNNTDRNFGAVANALKKGKNEDEILELLSVGVGVSQFLNGQSRIQYRDGVVYLDGKVLENAIVERVKLFASNGLPVEPILKFIENLEENPSYNSRNQLYGFLEHMDIVLTDDGCFLGYKAVRSTYYDKHSNTFLNTVGSTHQMDRRLIDDNPNTHCGRGLHVGSIHYCGKGGYFHDSGDRVMLVKVNPANAVCVPADHSCQQLRVCEYTVIGEVDEKLEAPLYSASGNAYDFQPSTYGQEDFEGFDYEEDDDYDSYDDGDIYSYDDEDDYEDDDDDNEDFFSLPEKIDF
jgi:hypothetical protein